MSVLSVAALMTKEPVTVAPEDSVREAKTLLEEHGIRHLPVVEDGLLVGVLSTSDLLRVQASPGEALTEPEQTAMDEWMAVSAVMKRHPLTTSPDAPVREAAVLLREARIGCLPVLDRSRLVGILTDADFVEWAIAELGDPGR